MNNEAAAGLYDSAGYIQLPEYDSVCRSPRAGFAARTGAPAARNRYHCKYFEPPNHSAQAIQAAAPAAVGPIEPYLADAVSAVRPVGALLASQTV